MIRARVLRLLIPPWPQNQRRGEAGAPRILLRVGGGATMQRLVGETVGDGDEFEVDLGGQVGLPVAGDAATQ